MNIKVGDIIKMPVIYSGVTITYNAIVSEIYTFNDEEWIVAFCESSKNDTFRYARPLWDVLLYNKIQETESK